MSMKIVRAKEFTADRAWGVRPIADTSDPARMRATRVMPTSATGVRQ